MGAAGESGGRRQGWRLTEALGSIPGAGGLLQKELGQLRLTLSACLLFQSGSLSSRLNGGRGEASGASRRQLRGCGVGREARAGVHRELSSMCRVSILYPGRMLSRW